MAIAFDVAAGGGISSSASLTFNSGNTAAAASIGVVCVYANGVNVTGITWNGVAMSQVINTIDGNQIWYILKPASGVKSIVVTAASSTYITAEALTYTGTGGSIPDASASRNYASNVNNVPITVATITDNCWLVGFCMSGTAINSAGSNTTFRGTQQTAASNIIQAADTNAVQTPPGNFTLNFNVTQSGLAGSGGAAMTINPPLVLTVTASVGAFVLAGVSATLTSVRSLAAAAGSFALAGSSVMLKKMIRWVNRAKASTAWTNRPKP